MSAVSHAPNIAKINRILLEDVSDFKAKDDRWTITPLYSSQSKDNFASVVYVAEASDTLSGKPVSLVIKVMHSDPKVIKLESSDKQFFNEATLLQTVVPTMKIASGIKDLKDFDVFPRVHYSDTNPEDAVIMMENLKVQGFKLADDIILDYDHCKLSFITIARMHALAYGLKRKHPAVFKEKIRENILEARYCDQNRICLNTCWEYVANDAIDVIYASTDPEDIAFRTEHSEFLQTLRKLFVKAHDLIEGMVFDINEPLATICAGDFNRNNIMFAYENGKPTKAKLLDFAVYRYSNPGWELSFFLYMNTTAEFRKKHLDDLLSIYQRTIVDSLAEMDVGSREELESIYSFAAFKDDFERQALVGYVIIAEFIHWMLAPLEELEELFRRKDLEPDMDHPSAEYLRFTADLGGEEPTRMKVAIIKELALMKNCIPEKLLQQL